MAFTVTTMQLLYDWAMDLNGSPYVWGGQEAIDNEAEFDCSGLIVEGLRRFGLIVPSKDLSAQGIYNTFKKYEVTDGTLQFGDAVFFGTSKSSITHIMMVMNEKMLCGAQGGGKDTNSKAEAVQGDGYVRLMPANYRGDRVAVVRLPWPRTKAEVTSGA